LRANRAAPCDARLKISGSRAWVALDLQEGFETLSSSAAQSADQVGLA
jgi:hypothetical protein